MNSIPNIKSLVPVVAQNVIYNNTTSGLQATNVQDAIDEVAQGGGGSVGTWTLVGSQQGTTPISLTGDENEIYICVKYNTNIYYSAFIVAAVLTSTEQQVLDGYYVSGSASALVNVGVTTSQVVLKAATIDGVAHLNDAIISVYSR